MLEIEVRTDSDVMTIAGPLGVKIRQRNTFYVLYLKDTGEKLPDNIYRVKHGDEIKFCNITKGRVTRSFSLDLSKPMYLL